MIDKKELFTYIKLHPNGNVQESLFKKKYTEHYTNICSIKFPIDFTFQQKLFHYFNDDYELKLGICPVCGKRCKYRRINEGYNKHCSTTCSSKDIVVKNKVKTTNLLKYGFEYSSKNESIKLKVKQTNLNKYGVDNPAKSTEVINKMISTNIKKYGKPNYSQTHLFAKQHKKKVFYDNIYFDSSWEIILYKYCIKTKKDVIYTPNITFKYYLDNKEHYYHPDFYIDGKLYEVKGSHFFNYGQMVNPFDHNLDSLYEKKHQCMKDNGVIILTEDDIMLLKNKLTVLEYLDSGIDKSGNLKKEGGFKKHYPKLYQQYLLTKFPDEISILPFKQKLWHFLNNVNEIPVCKNCGKHVNFLTRSGKWGYCEYCSGACAMKDKEIQSKLYTSKQNKYGDGKYNNSSKLKETLSKKDSSFWKDRSEKSIQTRFEKNNGSYFSDETIEKIKQTNIKKYGVDSFSKTEQFGSLMIEKHDSIQKKQYLTKSKNNSFNKSNIELLFENYLNELQINYHKQYKSDLYPFACDFYLYDIDLYIEIQGTWTHGGHPFDKTNINDIEQLNKWKSKQNKYYDNAIHTWTELDVKKRNMAKKNNLNYLEIFSDKIEICIQQFENYIKSLN